MKLREIRGKLVTRLKPGARYPNLEAISAGTYPQHASAFLQLPLEIRNAIFQEFWNNEGLAQHIIMKKGHYARARCVTDHEGHDELMDECSKTQLVRFADQNLHQRLTSSWGNHWKCEENYQLNARAPKGQFLAAMLVCRQLYLECREFICENLIFVIHDLDTLYNFTVSSPSPILNDLRHLELSIRLPISQGDMSLEDENDVDRWRDCCQELNQLQNLLSVYLWLDTTQACNQSILSAVLEGKANPYVFGERLANILEVSIPVNPDRPQVWQDVANIEPKFAIQARGWPPFSVIRNLTQTPYLIGMRDDWQEPGGPPMPTGYNVIRCAGRRRRRAWW